MHKYQISPDVFADEEVFHYSIPVVQQLGTGQIEDGGEIASAKQVITDECVLVSKLNPRKSTTCIATPQALRTLCSTEFVVLKPKYCDVRFLSYLVQTESFRQRLDSKVESVTRSHQRAAPEDIYKFWTAWPSRHDQELIGQFLDDETARIDALIEKKQRLIELLKEKRQAVITQAVTKGLDPNVPMKDSGVEWLGKVPEHWNIGAISWLSRVFNGATPSRSETRYWDGDLPWLSSGKVNDWIVTKPSELIIADAVTSAGLTKAPKGSVVIGLVGQGRTRGMPARLALDAYINQNIAAIVPGPSLLPSYLHYALVHSYAPVRELGRGGQQGALNCELVGAIRIPLPPTDEQIDICNYVDDYIGRCDRIISETHRSMGLLAEHRSALITAAVTGQIDVRDAA